MENVKKIYIIILNYNGWKDTIECLESILKSDYKNYQIIVVDNKSTDNSLDHIIDWALGRSPVYTSTKLKGVASRQVSKPLSYIIYDEEVLKEGNRYLENEYKLIFIRAKKIEGFLVEII